MMSGGPAARQTHLMGMKRRFPSLAGAIDGVISRLFDLEKARPPGPARPRLPFLTVCVLSARATPP
jgi:hypothetical protein